MYLYTHTITVMWWFDLGVCSGDDQQEVAQAAATQTVQSACMQAASQAAQKAASDSAKTAANAVAQKMIMDTIKAEVTKAELKSQS